MYERQDQNRVAVTLQCHRYAVPTTTNGQILLLPNCQPYGLSLSRYDFKTILAHLAWHLEGQMPFAPTAKELFSARFHLGP